MTCGCGRWSLLMVGTAAWIAAGCGPSAGARTFSGTADTTLRIGIGQMTANGIRTIAEILAIESLARLTDDGRLAPSLARDWVVSPDGRTVTVNLRNGVRFHDGSPLTAAVVVDALKAALPVFMGPAAEDVESVTAAGTEQVVIHLRQPSPFVLDALETTLQKPGAPLVGTGPFVVSNPQAPTEMVANRDYYLGNPIIQRVAIQTFPSIRAAWAEMLRGRIDMLYEVGTDALSSLEASTSIAIHTYTRRYQYAVVFNSDEEPLRDKAIRRALNMAIDREALVRDALDGHGTPSRGPVWIHNYAFRADSPAF